MYFPEGLKKRGEGPGAILVSGAALLSLVFGAAAFGWLGVAIGVAGLVLLILAEIYREASRLSGEREKLEEELRAARDQGRSARELEIANADLQRTVVDLRRRLRKPSLDPAHLLLGIKAYLDQIQIVRKHRELQDQVKDALVTQLELAQGKVTVSAICPEGAENLDKQPVAFVEARSKRAYGAGAVIYAASQDVRAVFELGELPTDLADELRANGTFSHQGYVLRLLGLCLEEYQQLSDQTLSHADDVLSKARETLATALLPQMTHDPRELLQELESDLDNAGMLESGEEENVVLDDGQGGRS